MFKLTELKDDTFKSEDDDYSYDGQDKEVIEALQAAANLLSKLEAARDFLNSARGWGTLDMLGGGFLSTYVKHNKLVEAQQCMNEAKQALVKFEKELRDVSKSIEIGNIDIDNFLVFADYFFDNFFTDMLVQKKIVDAINQIEEAISKVEDIRNELLGL